MLTTGSVIASRNHDARQQSGPTLPGQGETHLKAHADFEKRGVGQSLRGRTGRPGMMNLDTSGRDL